MILDSDPRTLKSSQSFNKEKEKNGKKLLTGFHQKSNYKRVKNQTPLRSPIITNKKFKNNLDYDTVMRLAKDNIEGKKPIVAPLFNFHRELSKRGVSCTKDFNNQKKTKESLKLKPYKKSKSSMESEIEEREDSSDMEASFHEIEKEEEKSFRIGERIDRIESLKQIRRMKDKIKIPAEL
ncbi:uncharacterized protein LOC135121207 isoform X2 [Zophobas morio]